VNIESLDTIAAIATPPGNGGVGIIRISGKGVSEIARQLLNKASSQDWLNFHLLPMTMVQ